MCDEAFIFCHMTIIQLLFNRFVLDISSPIEKKLLYYWNSRPVGPFDMQSSTEINEVILIHLLKSWPLILYLNNNSYNYTMI